MSLNFTRPSSTDKYFITKNSGGYYTGTYGMPNCVTFAWGWWYRTWGDPTMKDRVRGDPPAIWNGYRQFTNGGRGSYPRVGAMMIWSTGSGKGHIAICKSYKNAASVTWVESNFSAREKGKESLYWREVKNRNPKKYVGTFMGYIYMYTSNPYTYPTTVLTRAKFAYGKIKKGNDMVKWAQYELQKAGTYSGRIDGFFGPATEKAVRSFQNSRSDLSTDGSIGPLTRQALEVS